MRSTIRTPGGPALTLRFSPPGDRVAVGKADGTSVVAESATGKEFARFRGHVGGVLAVAFFPDGRLASGGADGLVKVWDGAGKEVRQLRGHPGAVRAIDVSGDGKQLLSQGEDGTRFWDPTTGKQGRGWEGGWNVLAAFFAGPDGVPMRLVVGSGREGAPP